MFQNIRQEDIQEEKKDVKQKSKIISSIFAKKNIILYIVAFMVSMVNVGQDLSPFSLAIVAACFASEVPAVGAIIATLLGTIIGFNVNGIITYILTVLVLTVSFFIIKPKYNDENRNEKIKIGTNLFISTLLIGCVKFAFNVFTIYDLLVTLTFTIVVYVFYKIFVNSLVVIRDFYDDRAFSIEEVIGASLLLAIAATAFGDLQVFGFSIRNILSILIVLIMGWQNGILVGTTSGVTIGVTLGIIANNNPVIVAAYAISGMIAGILNRFGKIGVIVGFIIGNGVLAYVANGGVENLIIFKEILIASIALLAMPKNIKLDITNFIGKSKFLPTAPIRTLNRSKEVVNKLNTVSNTIQDMAEKYADVAVTTIEEDDITEKNKQIFISELLNRLDGLKENMLYDDIANTEGKIDDEIFNSLIEKQELKSKDLLEILAKNNSYIVGFDDKTINEYLNINIKQILRAVNEAYKISKINFIWSKKFEQEKKNIHNQLNGVSKAISNIAKDMEKDIKTEDLYKNEKGKIVTLLKQKQIFIDELKVKRENNNRYFIEIYANDLTENKINTIQEILTEVFEEKIVLNERKNKTDKLEFLSDDKYICSVGIAQNIKDNSIVSGDSVLQIKLNDGKYLLAISDGMGSGPEARKSSQIAIKMLERLLTSGFERETSINLINSCIMNETEEIFATLDIAILDLYSGNVEFIKNGACPTYIKNKKKVQIVKSSTLPAGIINNIKLATFDRDIENSDIMVMCTDGILDSNVEYKNKELWIKYLLEDMESDNPQKIADIILTESVDNNYGLIKDDMSLIVCKFIKK